MGAKSFLGLPTKTQRQPALVSLQVVYINYNNIQLLLLLISHIFSFWKLEILKHTLSCLSYQIFISYL